jgi:hypothetical protein
MNEITYEFGSLLLRYGEAWRFEGVVKANKRDILLRLLFTIGSVGAGIYERERALVKFRKRTHEC